MSILFYIVATRAKNAFSGGSGAWMTAGGIVAGLFAVLYGLGFGFLAREAALDADLDQELGMQGMLAGVLFGMAVFGIAKDLIPSYKRRPNLVPPLAPLSGGGRWAVNQASAFLNLYLLAFLLFAASFAVFGLSAPSGLLWLSMLVAAVLVAEAASFTLRTLFEFEVGGRLVFGALAAVAAAAVPVAS